MATELAPYESAWLAPTLDVSDEAEPRSLKRELRSASRVALILTLIFFAVGGIWAGTAELAGAVIAAGVVNPQGSRKTIQHLEGGIIHAFEVREGDRVDAGQPLVVLEDVTARAEHEALRGRRILLAARNARLKAEREGAKRIVFDHPALAELDDPRVRDAIEKETNRFITREQYDSFRRGILGQRAAQLEAQIAGVKRQLEGVHEQQRLILRETKIVAEMVDKGYERLPRLLALQRSQAERTAVEGELNAQIARAREAMSEISLQIAGIDGQRLDEVDGELVKTQEQMNEIDEVIRKTTDRLARTVVTSPVSGIVHDMRFKTAGGVIRPGEPIMDVVPTGDEFIIEASISPRDVDDVHAGQEAYITFPSYPQRTIVRVPAKVRQVSPDALNDKQADKRFYAAKIELDPAKLRELAPMIELTPGLPADVFIATTERTVLEYLMQPLQQIVERGMRER
jgi:HlyD family type I secretion membrane fusion protein